MHQTMDRVKDLPHTADNFPDVHCCRHENEKSRNLIIVFDHFRLQHHLLIPRWEISLLRRRNSNNFVTAALGGLSLHWHCCLLSCFRSLVGGHLGLFGGFLLCALRRFLRSPWLIHIVSTSSIVSKNFKSSSQQSLMPYTLGRA